MSISKRSDELMTKIKDVVVPAPAGAALDPETVVPFKAVRPLCDAIANLEAAVVALEKEKK